MILRLFSFTIRASKMLLRTFVSNQICFKFIVYKTFGVVHHARTPSNVSKNDDRDRTERRVFLVFSSIVSDEYYEE